MHSFKLKGIGKKFPYLEQRSGTDGWDDPAKELANRNVAKYDIWMFDDNNHIAHALHDGMSIRDLPLYFKKVIEKRNPEERPVIYNKILSLSPNFSDPYAQKVLTCKSLKVDLPGDFIINDPEPVPVVAPEPVAAAAPVEFQYAPPHYSETDPNLEQHKEVDMTGKGDPSAGYDCYFPKQ